MSTSSNSTTKPTIGLNRVFHPALQPILEEKYNILLSPNFDYSTDICSTLEGLLVHGHTKINQELLQKFPNLKIISNHGVGIDHINVPDCTAKGVIVGNTPDVLTEATADMALALLLSVARKVVEGDAISRHPSTTNFNPYWFGREVYGSTVGIIGMGRIGQAIARRCALGFNCTIVYHNRTPVSKQIETLLNNATYYASILAMVPLCDYVVLAAPATPETYHLLKTEHFAAMKPHSYFINISRGTLVDQDSLIYALHNGPLEGAGLDVTDPEPLPRDHPLLACKNCIITPHTGSATYQTRQAMLELAIDNLTNGLQNKVLIASPNQHEVLKNKK